MELDMYTYALDYAGVCDSDRLGLSREYIRSVFAWNLDNWSFPVVTNTFTALSILKL